MAKNLPLNALAPRQTAARLRGAPTAKFTCVGNSEAKRAAASAVSPINDLLLLGLLLPKRTLRKERGNSRWVVTYFGQKFLSVLTGCGRRLQLRLSTAERYIGAMTVVGTPNRVFGRLVRFSA